MDIYIYTNLFLYRANAFIGYCRKGLNALAQTSMSDKNPNLTE